MSEPEIFKNENQNGEFNTIEVQPVTDIFKPIPTPRDEKEIVDVILPNTTFETLLQDLGCFGPYQVLVLCLYLFMEVAATFVVFIPIFIGRGSTSANCTEESISIDNATIFNMSSKFSLPEVAQEFTGVVEEPYIYESMVDEWGLTCDRAWLVGIPSLCLMIGMVGGNIIGSSMSDWYGRKKAHLMFAAIMGIGSILSAFSPNIYVYAAARFIAGAGFCTVHIASIAVIEFMSPKWRCLASGAGPMGEATIILALMAYYIRPWRILYFATLAPYLLLVLFIFIMPESPRWLIRNNRIVEAHLVLGYMAKMNGKKPVSLVVLEELRRQEAASVESTNAKRITYWQFLKTEELRTKSLYMMVVWFAWMMGYYGLSYNLRNVPGNVYINVGLSGLANSIGQRVSIPATERIGRRKGVLYSMTLTAICMVILAICFLTMKEVNSTLIIAGCFVGLFGLGMVRVAARLLSGESFPTSVRAMGFAVCGMGGNIAAPITPQIGYLGEKNPATPFFILSAISVIAAFVVLRMKETKGSALSDEINVTEKSKEPH